MPHQGHPNQTQCPRKIRHRQKNPEREVVIELKRNTATSHCFPCGAGKVFSDVALMLVILWL